MPQSPPADPAVADMPGATDDSAPLGEKHEPKTTGAALIQRSPLPKAVAQHVLSDDEIRRTWRVSSALATSNLFKEAAKPEVAFARVLIGRDLGISPTQALMTIELVKGNIFMRGVLLASFIRRSRDYEYKVLERTNERCVLLMLGFPGDYPDQAPKAERGKEQPGDAVWHRRQWWEVLSREEFTIEDAKRAGLVKADSNWLKYPKNMCFWRCVSNGAKFEASELLGGVPVYTEADDIPAAAALGDGEGTGQPADLDLGPDVEAVIARATELGHAALAERGTIEMLLGDQPPAKVAEWVREANRELDAIPAEAEVVDDAPQADLSGEQPEVADPTPEAEDGAQVPGEAGEATGFAELSPEEQERIAALRRRGEELLNNAEALASAGDPRADEVFEEFEIVSAQVEAAGNVDQGSLPL